MLYYEKVHYTIRQFRDDIYYCTDVQPVGQRLPVYSKGNKKAKGIIETLLMGFDVGTITIMKLEDSEYTYESIDGGHRKRALWDYLNNRVSVNGKYFRDLDRKTREAFLDIKLSFTVYNPLGAGIKGHIFRTTNKTTDVNFMEMLNSYGDITIANHIRQTVRVVKGIENDCHSLFTFYLTNKDNYIYEYLQFDNDRLKQDHAFARIVYRYMGNHKTLLGGSPDSDIESLYEDETLTTIDKQTQRKIHKHLDFLRDMAIYRKKHYKTGLTQHEFKVLSYLYFALVDKYSEFELDDAEKLFSVFAKANSKLMNKNGEYATRVHTRSGYTENVMYKKYVAAPMDSSKVIEATQYLLKEMDRQDSEWSDALRTKDPVRNFSVEDKQAKLAEQDFTCFIDGSPLTWEDAHAAHIRAHKKGGRTEYANLAMIRNTHNSDMGTMDVLEYKRWYQNQEIAA
jgi:hypothetical protein